MGFLGVGLDVGFLDVGLRVVGFIVGVCFKVGFLVVGIFDVGFLVVGLHVGLAVSTTHSEYRSIAPRKLTRGPIAPLFGSTCGIPESRRISRTLLGSSGWPKFAIAIP